jgi:hypothetical protein
MDARLPDFGPTPESTYDPESIFWTHERLHRATLLNYPERIETYAAARDALEKKFVRGALEILRAAPQQRAEFATQCFHESRAAEVEWLERAEAVPARKSFLHAAAWNSFNQKAGMPALN